MCVCVCTVVLSFILYLLTVAILTGCERVLCASVDEENLVSIWPWRPCAVCLCFSTHTWVKWYPCGRDSNWESVSLPHVGTASFGSDSLRESLSYGARG